MPASCSPRSRAAGRAAALLLLLAAAAPAAADDCRGLLLREASDALFAPAGDGEPNVRPGEGEVAIVCRFDDSAFAVADLSRVTVLLPSGGTARLIVEQESVWTDFDEIVSLRFAVVVPEAETTAKERMRIRWGEGVKAEYEEVPVLRPDPALRSRFREAAWAAEGTPESGDTQVATIEVVADSRARYDFLLYLLPIAVLLVVLFVRKVKTRDIASPPPP